MDIWNSMTKVLLPLIPVLAVFGNALVILAVHRERSLQSVTNMLIVSLAVSDFMVAIGVMSFGVYYEFNDFDWQLGEFACDIYQALDVACSTASILNLLAISLDRYIAIQHPISYAQYGARGGRAMASITVVWGISITVALPLLLGVNPMEDGKCELSNPYFNMISSIFSFFIPCIAMIILYTIIFRRLRQRERARSLRQAQKSETDKISSALLGGAHMAAQMGKHFKNRTDQILLEISFQTSSFPTISESSDEGSTVSPLTYNTTNFLLPKKENSPITTQMVECESMPNLAVLENSKDSDEMRKDTTAMDFQTSESPELMYSCTALNSYRSFGDELEEALPFIDSSGSVKNSKEHLHIVRSITTNPIKLLDVKPELRSVSVPSIQDERKLAQQLRDGHMETTKIEYRQHNIVENRNGAHKQRLSPSPGLFTKSKSTTLLKTNGYIEAESFKGSNYKLPKNGHIGQDDFSLSNSVRRCRSRLWKRLTKATTGWSKSRPSRHLVKKATKQMRREHKATVTLAVVLAVFLICWLPFFTLHLSNSICKIHAPNETYIPDIALFIATWLGYLNSSLNPLIYTVFDQRFRNGFRNILRCRNSRK